MEHILENAKYCTGCTACVNKCPVHAICMKENNQGFLYPSIDEEKCINCGLCEQVCPAISSKEQAQKNIQVYAAISNNEEERLRSSSGGLFYEFGKINIEKHKGLVYGAIYDKNWNLEHKAVETIKDLGKMQGSKYVQSNLGECFKEVKERLKENRNVLFVGTPCQIDGLNSYLGEKPNNLITIDFVCHGVPSPKIWCNYIQELKSKYHSEIVSINQRSKEKKGWKKSSTKIVFATGQIYEKVNDDDEYMCLFLNDYILRESCYHCKYRNFDRCSDISMGDFWGIESVRSRLNDNKGTSLLLINTEQGRKFFEQVKEDCDWEIHRQEECMQAALNSNLSIPKERNNFWILFEAEGYGRSVKKYGKRPLHIRFIQKICLPIVRKLGIYKLMLDVYKVVKG